MPASARSERVIYATPGVGAQRTRNVSNTRRRQRSDDEHVHTKRSDSGHERVFQHVTGKPSVLAQHDFGTRTRRRPARIHLREHICCGTTKSQRSLRRDRFHVRDAAHAISAKNFPLLSHGVIETLKERFVNGKLFRSISRSRSRRRVRLTFSPDSFR